MATRQHLRSPVLQQFAVKPVRTISSRTSKKPVLPLLQFGIHARVISDFIFLLISFLSIGGCIPSALLIQPVSPKRSLKEYQIMKDHGLLIWDKIAVIDVDGLMINARKKGWLSSGENPVSFFQEKLDKAAHDKRVKAVVIRLNTPGGTVSASDTMYHSLMQFKHKTHKPVIASMMGVAASGGYYLACGCDGIVAQPSTVTGSIGTIMQTVSFKGTMDKLGIKAVAITSGNLKDMGSPFKDLRDNEKIIMQQIINQFYQQFLKVVAEGRPRLTAQQIRILADGRVYTAPQALEKGLIDQIGYPGDAVRWAKELAGIEKARVVIYNRPYDNKTNIYDTALGPQASGPLLDIELPSWFRAEGPQFLYLWQGQLP